MPKIQLLGTSAGIYSKLNDIDVFKGYQLPVTLDMIHVCIYNLGPIVWEHWRRLVRWSDEGVVAITKLTQDHIYPKGSLKMRNRLAEEVLNRELLNSMKVNLYKTLHHL